MEYVPFIYFLFLTVWLWHKHKKLDICVYMSSLYAFTSFCCILILQLDYLEEGGILFDRYDVELNIIPTILYCFFLTLGILPFSMIYKKDLKRIVTAKPLYVDMLSWFLIFIALLNLYLVADSTVDILNGDLEKVRQAVYEGIETPAQIKAQSMPFILRFLYYFNVSTLLALPLSFYYACCTKKPWWFCVLLFLTSLSQPIAGIQGADRTEIMFFFLMLIFCLVFFNDLMSRKMKHKLKIAAIPFLAISITYFVAVTIARFGERDGGAEGGALQYAGQGYLNFCYFYEKGRFEYIRPEREFPFIAHTLYKVDSNMERRSERSGEQGFFMSVFATYIGDIMLDISPLGMMVWMLYYFMISVLIIKMSHRTEIDISELLLIFLMAVIPIFGVFYYRYFSFTYTYMIVLAALLYVVSRQKLTIR